MNLVGKVIVGVAGGLSALFGIGWFGLQVVPPNLTLPVDEPQSLGTVPVPSNLPAPVHRYFQVTVGAAAPRVESLAIYGRARANFGIWLPLRYRLVHRPGYDYERYMEVTWFGLPVLKAIDRYLDGVGITGPVGRAATGPAIDQASNMILWAEAPAIPSLWLTDTRIRWEAIDDQTVRLIFPFGEEEDELTVHFDPESGLITQMTALRYRDAASGKVPWRIDFLSWRTYNEILLPERVAITWEDQGQPWSYWELENVFWNVDISETLATRVTVP